MNIEDFPRAHISVWTTLELLDDGQRIIGADLLNRSPIKDRRSLYHVIKELRQNGFLVGSSKHAQNRGYYEIRDEQDLYQTVYDLRKSANSLLETAKQIELSFYEKER